MQLDAYFSDSKKRWLGAFSLPNFQRREAEPPPPPYQPPPLPSPTISPYEFIVMVSKCVLAVSKRKSEQNKLLWSRATLDTNYAKKILTVCILKIFLMSML